MALGRRAVALAPLRTDYVVGLGASLVCVGTREHDDEALAEGLRWLERAASLPELMDTDAEDRARASRMRQNPSEACHDSRDGAVHFD